MPDGNRLDARIRTVVDFDHHSADYAQNWVAIGRKLREEAPIAWTSAHGGYWIASRYRDVVEIARDWETFSSENDHSGQGNGGEGIFIPRNPFRFELSESDPPQATGLRRIEQGFFVHGSVNRWESVVRAHAQAALDAVIASGEIEFVHDLAIKVPAKTVLQLAGIAPTDWEAFALSAHSMSHMPPTHPDYPHREIALVQGLLVELVRARRVAPRDDVISALAHGKLNGSALSEEMVVGVVSAIVFGGFDTTTTAVLDLLLILDERPVLRKAVSGDRGLLEAAIEESLRLHPPSHALARTVMKDTELHGQCMAAGDRILMLWSAANRDPRKFERPDEFRLDRPNSAMHLSFGHGPHRCLGSLLAKMAIRVTLETILARMPDYRMVHATVERYRTIGTIAGFLSARATFTPSAMRPSGRQSEEPSA